MRSALPRPPHFPYTTLFRSLSAGRLGGPGSTTEWRPPRNCHRSFCNTRNELHIDVLGCSARPCPVPSEPCVVLGTARRRLTLVRSEEHTSELQSREKLVCRL